MNTRFVDQVLIAALACAIVFAAVGAARFVMRVAVPTHMTPTTRAQ